MKKESMMKYCLMHHEIPVAELEIDEYANITAVGEIYQAAHLPIGTIQDGQADRRGLNRWWTKRSIPVTRPGIREALWNLNLSSPQELLLRCYGLSLSDQYWVSPIDTPLSWNRVNFFENEFSEDIGNVLFGGHSIGDSEQLNYLSPDSTLEGQLRKKWKILNGSRILLKGGREPYFQEPYNEVIASRISERLGIPHTEYQIIYHDGNPCSVCEDFITADTELVPAQYVLQQYKRRSDISEYEHCVSCFEALGVPDARRRLEQMLVLDYLTVNTDRHFNNFGLIRNARTLETVGMAPIYDCGNSLWFNILETRIDAYQENLPAKVFRRTQEAALSLVSDFSWFDIRTLDGIEDECDEILSSAETISPERRRILRNALGSRIDLLYQAVQKFEERNTISLK